jgi:D-alanyl-D-alanine carboxypeptidase (penicillin-binding protein 5/6)
MGFKKIRKDILLLGLVLILVVASWLWVQWKFNVPLEEVPIYTLEKIEYVPVAKQEVQSASVSAQSFIVMDLGTGTILAQKNATQSAYPASTTKLMSAMVAEAGFNPEQELMVTEEDLVNGNKLGFVVGEKVKVKDLIKAMLISSSNEAAYILANNYPQGFSGFVREMSLWAEDLNMDSTLYTNPAGFDNQALQSSARDLAVLVKEFMNHPQLVNITKIKETDIGGSLGEEILTHNLVNTNYLLHSDERFVGLKTGTTQRAQEVLISVFNYQAGETTYPLVTIVMGSQDRYNDTLNLIEEVTTSYQWVAVNDDFELQY